MLKQVYTDETLMRVVEKKDIRKWKLWDRSYTQEEKKLVLKKIQNDLINSDFQLSSFSRSKRKQKWVYYPSNKVDYLAIKLLDRYLRRIYKVIQADRNKIIRQIKSLLEDEGDFIILKVDIENFYESVDLQSLISKIQNDMILSPQGIKLLKSLALNSPNGLPRGIGISSTLAELYLENFDKEIKNHESVFYYCRYVDDIFILLNKQDKKKVKNTVVNQLNLISLNINKIKEKEIILQAPYSQSFDYLGYNFQLKKELKTNGKVKKTELIIQVAKSKMNKIMNKLYLAFLDYQNNNDISLLMKRLRFLAYLKVIKNTKNGKLRAGNAFNYSHISTAESFKTLDALILKTLIPKFVIDQSHIQKIKTISFYRAFKSKQTTKFTRRQLKDIQEIWKYV